MVYKTKLIDVVTENGDVISVPADDGEIEKLAETFKKNTEKQIKLIMELEKKNAK